MRMLLSLMLSLLVANAASAVLVASENNNNSAPADNPGWERFGTRTGTNDAGQVTNGLTHIYIGNGWILTAEHVGVSDFKLNGVIYPRVSGSGVQLQNPDGSDADLLVFQISGNPDLPNLGIAEFASITPSVGTEVLLIGRGALRGNPTTWVQPPLRSGWDWQSVAGMRWGTNQISAIEDEDEHGTAALVMDFTKPGDAGFTSDEAQAVLGDSGGGVWVKNGGEWQLAGVLFAAAVHSGQPNGTSVDGNLSMAADLAKFRPQLISLVRPECSDEVDNNGNGLVDFPDDPECSSLEDDSEATPVPSASLPGKAALGLACVAGGFVHLLRRRHNTEI